MRENKDYLNMMKHVIFYNIEGGAQDREMLFHFIDVNDCDKRKAFKFEHLQDCCEDVYISDIDGDTNDLIGCKIYSAEEVSENMEDACESGTWTFYKFRSGCGYVTIRWNGQSNGYYSEGVNISIIDID